MEELALRGREQGRREAFVAASRLQDIADILGGLQTVYTGVEPRIASVDDAQATQTKQDLEELTSFAERLRDEEAGGKKFTAEDAETLAARPRPAPRRSRPDHPGRRPARHPARARMAGTATS